MMKQTILAGALATCLFAAGCGGGDSGNSGGAASNAAGATGTAYSVSGPLTPVQSTLSGSVLSPLASAAAGTPLQGVVTCTDVIVNHNALDILNAVLNGVTNSSTASQVPTEVQSLVSEMANNLGGLLSALSGKGSCGNSSGGGSGIPTGNPLAGTPLAPVGAALLPVLQQIQGQTGSGSGSSPNSLAQLATLIDQLNVALQTGLAQVPSSAKSQPVVGGVLTTLGTTVSNLASMMDAVGANNSAGFQSATQTMLYNLLVNLLTQVVPTAYIETQAGKPGTVTGPIQQAASTFSSTAAGALGQGASQLMAALSNSQLQPVLSPVNTVLSAILGPINKALAGSSSGSSSGGPTGTPLDAVLGPLSSTLSSILGGTGSSCVFASTPLSALCKLLP